MIRVRTTTPSIGTTGLAVVGLVGALATGLTVGLPPAAAAPTAASTVADGRYIVSFTEAATDADVAAARERAVAAGAQIRYDYGTALAGFAAVLPDSARADLVTDPSVASVEPDEVMSINSTQNNPTAGLDRIDQRATRLNNTFRYATTGKGVTAYVIDTGVMASHSEFGGRVQAGRSFTSSPATTDCGEGHGTHVAGLIGGRRYGVAKSVTIVPVKVFGCDGAASVSTVIAGIDWATADAKKRPGPAVANLSAGVDRSMGRGLERAVKNAISSGLTFVTAAGNEGGSACAQSPARVGPAITVGAVNRSDRRAGFSNYGKCVDLFAPGVAVLSAGIGSTSDTAVKDGTSMAAPLVTGVVASFLQRYPTASVSKVRAALFDATTKGKLRGIGSSPNRLLYSKLRVVNRSPKVSSLGAALPGKGRSVNTGSVPVHVSWKGSDPDGTVVRYEVQRSTNGGRTWRSVALPTKKARSITLNLGKSGGHRFRVRAVDDLGRRGAWRTSNKLRVSIAQQGSAKFRKTWTSGSAPDLMGGSSRSSANRGGAAIYKFSGRTIRWIGTTDASYGKAKVYLDGMLVATVDTYSATRKTCRVLFAKTVKPGKHTLKIVVLGKHGAKSGGNRVDLDAFVVTN
ncbi:S8 family serine peptidase [Sporichthya polymorpha]|uniref:S8 family serine peptidase n=1 Tax=Sporichthya polymorpha TaxID=35751 RepID=UPI0003673009|nr:S8 family serine peptidase [Sporichthya polymorpha]